MKTIQLTKKQFTIVDDDDFDMLSKVKWCVQGVKGYQYAVCHMEYENGRQKHIRMHRLIMEAKEHQLVDHIDGNTLNNTKGNLRIIDKSGNARNKKSWGSSKYLGVSRHRKKWIAHIKVGDKYKHLGVFENEIDAAKAYNSAIKHYSIQFARPNVI